MCSTSSIKLILNICLFLLLQRVSSGQTPEWPWARSAYGYFNDIATATTTDTHGNVYVTGYYKSLLDFRDTVITGRDAIFIVKYDSLGTIRWARSADGLGGINYANDIAVDTAGNVFLTGSFSSPDFTIGNITLINSGKLDMYIAKYDSSGTVLWAASGNGQNHDAGLSISTDKSGNAYVTGHSYSPTIILGSDTLVNHDTATADILIAKYDPDGTLIWSRLEGGIKSDIAYTNTIDSAGSFYLAGPYESPTIQFDNVTLVKNVDDSATTDIFVTKYDIDGNVQWARSFGGTGYELASKITTDGADNLYLTGSFNSPLLNLGIFTLENAPYTDSIPKQDVDDIYVANLDRNGNVRWARSIKGTGGRKGGGSATSRGIVRDSSGNIYVTGFFRLLSLDLDSMIIKDTTSDSINNYNMFIAKYDSTGEILWGQNIGDNAATTDLAIYRNDIYITGYFYGAALYFGNERLGNYTQGNSDIFIAKLRGNDSLRFDSTISSIGNYEENRSPFLYPNPSAGSLGIAVEENGNWELHLFTLRGEIVHQVSLSRHEMIKLSGLAKGVYVYRLLKNNKTERTGKLILE